MSDTHGEPPVSANQESTPAPTADPKSEKMTTARRFSGSFVPEIMPSRARTTVRDGHNLAFRDLNVDHLGRPLD